MAYTLLEVETKQVKDVSDYEKQIYDLKQLLEISKSFSSVLEYNKVIESILYICMCQMRTLSAALFTKPDINSQYFTLGTNYTGMSLDPDVNYSISDQHRLVNLLESTNLSYSYDEMVEILKDGAKDIGFLAKLSPSLIVPLVAKKRLNGILVLGERIDLGDGSAYSDYEKEQILNIASLASLAINNSALVDMASTDMMTHLKLKHFFFSKLIESIDAAIMNNQPLCVFMLDIDHFKQFNDTYGHACGDMVLIEVASMIKQCVRNDDLVARYGGEEFVVLLSDIKKSEAFKIAEKIRTTIADRNLEFEGKEIHVTISIGLKEFTAKRTITANKLVEDADAALYVSKNTGRNKTTIYSAHKKEPVAQN